MTKIDDYDFTKPKNKKAFRELERIGKIPISDFPRSSNFSEIAQVIDHISKGNDVKPEMIGRENEHSILHVKHTMKTIRLLKSDSSPTDSLFRVARQTSEEIKFREISVLVSRSNWFLRWRKWAGVESILDMSRIKAYPFLSERCVAADRTLRQISSYMNTILKQTLQFHPATDTSDRPDVIAWDDMQRIQHDKQSIYEPGLLIPAMKRVAEEARFVKVGTGYISVQGYDFVARNLNDADVRLLVGSEDRNGRMQIANYLEDFRKSIEGGPDGRWKIEAQKKLRSELLNRTTRVRCLKARHLPHHHAKVQIYDRSAVIMGSANISYNGLVKNIEGCAVLSEETEVRYWSDNWDNYFLEGIPIEDELLEILDKSWAINSDELVNPQDAYLRILLEMYGDSENEQSPEGISLSDYQEYSVNKSVRDLIENRGSLLVAPTGTGKTLMGTFVAFRLKQKSKIERVFLVTPNPQISDKWEDEFLKFGIQFQTIPLSTFRTQTNDWKERLDKLKKSINGNDLVIVDECHHVMNDGSGTNNLRDLLGKPDSRNPLRLFLTATPMSKGLKDLNNLLGCVSTHSEARRYSDVATLSSVTYLTHPLIARHFAKETETGDRFVDFSGKHMFFAKKKTEQLNYDSTTLDKLIEILTDMPLETIKKLPKGQFTIDGSPPVSPGNRNELVRVHLSRSFESSPAQGINATRNMLESNLNENYYFSEELEQNLKDCESILESQLSDDGKLRACIEFIRETVENNGRVLIFCMYKKTVEYLKQNLEKEFGVNVSSLTGDDTKKNKDTTCERFSPVFRGKRQRKSDPQILIATDCLSEGIDLPDASLMVNYDLFWTPLKLVQRVGRLDRPTKEKREFTVANLVTEGTSYDNLFGLQSRLGNRSTMYRKMAGIDVFSDNVRDLDNLEEEQIEHLRELHGENPDLAFERYMDQFATKVLGQLARATDEDRKRAQSLPIGAISTYDTNDSKVGILSVVKDKDEYSHVLSEHFEDKWGGLKIEAEDQEEMIVHGYPDPSVEPKRIEDSFFDKHEVMLLKLAEKYDCEPEDLTPIISLSKTSNSRHDASQ